MCFLEKRYRNSEEGQVAITLTLEIGTFFIFYVDITNNGEVLLCLFIKTMCWALVIQQ